MDGYTITSHFNGSFTLLLPAIDTTCSAFCSDCSTLTIQTGLSSTRSGFAVKATTFPSWHCNGQSSQTICHRVSSETLSLHSVLLIPLA